MVLDILTQYPPNTFVDTISNTIHSNPSQVHIFWSSAHNLAPSSWKHSTILQLPQNGTQDPSKPSYVVPWWTAFNTSPTRGKVAGKEAYVVAIELGSPTELIGQWLAP